MHSIKFYAMFSLKWLLLPKFRNGRQINTSSVKHISIIRPSF